MLGAAHLAFEVEDIEETFRRLERGGARVMNPPAELAPGRIGCYLQDPDGNWLELLQLVTVKGKPGLRLARIPPVGIRTKRRGIFWRPQGGIVWYQ